MKKNIDPQLKTIGDYLKLDENTVFNVPAYQRAYSWGISNCDKLWQDIIDYVEDGCIGKYFFGTIIINCQEDDTKYDLIDGQQRTTTFLILLKALLVRINSVLANAVDDEDTRSYMRGLQERRRRIMGILYKVETEDISDKPIIEEDSKICSRDIILENNSINERYRNELTNILQTTDFEGAEAHSERIKYKQKENRFTNYFKNYKFFYSKVCDLPEINLNNIAKTITEKCEVIVIKSWDVEQAIKMFNSLNSDGLPLFDADIISAQLFAEAEKQGRQDEFSQLWKKIREQIGELEAASIADINSILMQYMYYVRASNKEIISETGSVNVTTPGLRRYFIEDNKESIKDPIKMCNDILHIVSVWNKISEISLTKILLKFNENSKLFLASYFFRLDNKNITEQSIQIILECLLRLFTVLELVDYGYSSKYFKTFLFGEEVKFVDDTINLDEIKKEFDAHIRSNWTKEKLLSALEDYNGNLLVYLNEYLFAKNKGMKLRIGSKYDIEHIMPYSGNNLSEIRKDAEIENEEEFEEIVNKLGNKILLEEKINRAIGNEWFRTKVSTKLGNKTGYLDSQYPLACELVQTYSNVNKPYWTKGDIDVATKKACKRIVDFIFDEQDDI